MTQQEIGTQKNDAGRSSGETNGPRRGGKLTCPTTGPIQSWGKTGVTRGGRLTLRTGVWQSNDFGGARFANSSRCLGETTAMMISNKARRVPIRKKVVADWCKCKLDKELTNNTVAIFI